MKQASPNCVPGPNLTVNTDDLILQRVATLLAPFNRNDIVINRGTQIIADLEVDSVAVFDLIMEVEDGYDITFPMETISEMKSVGDLVDTIRTLKNA